MVTRGARASMPNTTTGQREWAVARTAAERRGDAESVVNALKQGSDERLQGFRSESAEALEHDLLDEGYRDRRPRCRRRRGLLAHPGSPLESGHRVGSRIRLAAGRALRGTLHALAGRVHVVYVREPGMRKAPWLRQQMVRVGRTPTSAFPAAGHRRDAVRAPEGSLSDPEGLHLRLPAVHAQELPVTGSIAA